MKDYIYIGNRLLAEYKPQEDKMYFYTPDQINSTRIVTDSTGTVVYSAAHDPYGGMHKTWVNTYDPTPKFSGKERDAESGLDYFGARYKDPDAYPYLEGYWRRTHYTDRMVPGVDETGFYGFNAPSEHWGGRGVHAGRDWWDNTGGCIRTTKDAMKLMNKLEKGGDPISFLVVVWDVPFAPEDGFCDISGIYSQVEFYMRNGGQSEGVISNVLDSLDRFFELYYGPLNFTFDYFFNSDSPIPPQAR